LVFSEEEAARFTEWTS
jgi:Reverse transcriptase (RNA-dependent DNA polymerase)